MRWKARWPEGRGIFAVGRRAGSGGLWSRGHRACLGTGHFCPGPSGLCSAPRQPGPAVPQRGGLGSPLAPITVKEARAAPARQPEGDCEARLALPQAPGPGPPPPSPSGPQGPPSISLCLSGPGPLLPSARTHLLTDHFQNPCVKSVFTRAIRYGGHDVKSLEMPPKPI